MTFYSPAWLLLASVLVSLCISGCGGSGTRPELVPVKGRVTLDGQPLQKALVVFRSEAGGRGSRSMTASDGSYELTYLREMKGAQPGKNTVSITTASEGQPIERVPRKYNKDSTLVVDVPGRDGLINFDLTSK